jgi:hypothetical protein
VANTLLTSTAITREALRILHQRLNFIGAINRTYDNSFAKDGAKIGDTLKIRLPNQYTVRTGRILNTQDTVESNVSLTVATQKGVDLNFTSAELTLSLDDFSDRILKPAMSVLAANIEGDLINRSYKKIYQQVNNQGSPATFAKVLATRKILVDSLASPDLNMLLNTQDNVDIVNDNKNLFNDQKEISKQYKDGSMGRAAGFDFWENTFMPAHTRGAGAGYQVNGAGQTGNSLVVSTGTGAVNQGDVFTIAGVFRVHPETKVSTGILQQFVVTSNFAGGAGTLAISPAIVPTGPRQNVTMSPGANAAITFAGTASTASGISLAFDKDAFAFVTADLVMPKGVDFASRQVLDGISMRIVRAYSISDDTFPCRLDILYGDEVIRPELAVRVASN